MESTTVATKKKSERREEQLAIRLTEAESKRLAHVVSLFPASTKSTVVRAALLAGLDVVERQGITIAPSKRRR